MTTYDGPATVTTDHAEYPVTAQLTLASDGGLKEWYGSLEAQDEEAAWNIAGAGITKLRIGGDREGTFMALRYTAGSTEMGIQGSGPAPFGD